jgi:hypothetical protein
LAHHEQIQDDSTFWQILASLWIENGTTVRLDDWRRLFLSARRNRHKLMKKHDRQTWRSLPNKVTAYRAAAPGENLDFMISWTIDRSFLERVYRGREIISRVIPREQIIAYFDRRGERELIVWPREALA